MSKSKTQVVEDPEPSTDSEPAPPAKEPATTASLAVPYEGSTILRGTIASVADPTPRKTAALPSTVYYRFDFDTTQVGSTAHVDVHVDKRLGTRGVTVAKLVLKYIEIHYTRVADAFRATNRPRVNLIITALSNGNTGGGGGYHYEGVWEIYTDVQKVSKDSNVLRWDFCNAIFVAEIVELFAWSGGWDSKWTNGEALSRFLANSIVPKVLEHFETTPVWRNGGSPDYVSKSLETYDARTGHPYDIKAVGCEVCFLYYLRWRLNIPLTTIIAATPAGKPTTLESTFYKLTKRRNGFVEMKTALDKIWPPGKVVPWGIKNDNLWDRE